MTARRLALPALASILVMAGAFGSALAQGQDSTTSTQAPHTNAHPAPLLSTDSVTSVPSGTVLQGTSLPAEMKAPTPTGFAPPGPVTIPKVSMACGSIADATAKARCSSRSEPAAPPHE